ncbi:MAG: sensor histidine kinase, partial [Mycobacteriales bacterium]
VLAGAGLANGLSELRREEDRVQGEAALEDVRSARRTRHVLETMIGVADEERNRIAMGLHDDTIQVMVAALMALDQATRAASEGAATTTVEGLGRVREMLTGAVDRIRHLTFDLRPPALTENGLHGALTDLARQAGADTGAGVALTVTHLRFSDDIEGLAYRTVRELVTNVRKHSGAHRIAIEIDATDGNLVGSVDDDGIGFDPGAVDQRPDHHLHMGLDATKQRIVLAGGHFAIDSTPNHGAHARFDIPCASRPASIKR